MYEANEEKTTSLFGTNYLPAYSSLQGDIYYDISPGNEFAKYIILTFEGVDDDNNSIEATGRVDLLPL